MTDHVKQLKFLFVIDNLSTGGAQRQMVNLALGLKKRGYQIEIFCYSPGNLLAQPLEKAEIPIYWQIKKNRYSPNVIVALRKLMRHGKFDLVLSFLTTPNFYAILASGIVLSHIPVIVSERFCDLPGGVTIIERLARQFYRYAKYVVTNSHHQRKNLSRKYTWLKNRITTIYNGYDLDVFFPASDTPDNQEIKILAIASVSPYKNGMCLVEAINILKNEGMSLQVDWIGQLVLMGDRLDYLNQMNTAITTYGLKDQWHWLNQRTDIVEQIHKHDVLVHPSFGEGLPNVVCEAMACGRPVILSDTLDHANLIQDGVSGLLFDYLNPTDLAEKLKIFIRLNHEERIKMGNNGRKFAETNLSLRRYVDEYEQLFLSVTNDGEKK